MTIRSFRHSRPLSAIALALALPACLTDEADDWAPGLDDGDTSSLADDVKVTPPGPAAKLWDQPQAIDNVLVRPYYRKTLTLSGSPAIHTITTVDLQQGGSWEPDPVIIAQSGTEQWTNDNCVGKAACVLLPGTLTSVTVTIFGRQPQAYGTTDVLVDGVKVENDVPFGGTLIPISWNPAGTDFAIQTVGKPGGTLDETIFHLASNFEYKASNTSSGILAHAKLIATPVQGDFILVASPVTATNPGTGLTRVLFNSCLSETDSCTGTGTFNGDTDGDGLANYLEAQIGTSASNRDTDGDGIFDYQEVIGLKLGADEEDLPRYGADPRHGDLFVEMDTSFWDGGPEAPTVSDNPATEITVSRMADMFARLSRWSNPDGTTGIRLHVDGNTTCSDPTMCGDWGGTNHYRHECVNPSEATARANMAPWRHGVFHYTLRTCKGASSPDAISAISRIGNTNNADNGEVWAHELGHQFGLKHHGDPLHPEEGKLNHTVAYPSTMNYGYQNRIGGDENARFSAGRMGRIRPENQEEVGYSVGQDKAHLDDEPYFYGLSGDNVDFNGDGRVSQTPVWFDPGPTGKRGGNWGDIRDLRDIETRVPTGGVGMAVLPTVSGGSTSRVYIAAPYQHGNGVYPEIRWATENVAGTPGTFGGAVASQPLPGGGDPSGEVAAALVVFESAPAVFVTMPASNGRLYFAHFRTTNHTWTSWTQMPAWHPETRARQATVVNTQDRMYLLYRDINAAEDVPNVWMNTFEEGQWRGWSLLNVPSYLTPGLAVGPDDQLYLLHMKHTAFNNGTIDLQLALSSAEWAAWPAAVTFTPVNNLNWPGDGFGSAPIADAQRPRLTLLSLPHRQGGGAPFADGSHYLAAYWASGQFGTAEALQDGWAFRRAYVPGYISPFLGPCFGKTIEGDGCSATADVRVRFQTSRDRPWPAYSPAVATRWNVVSAAYVQSAWDGDGAQDTILESNPTPIAYQPWANGIYPGHWEIRDTNDAAVMRRNACKSLWSLTNQECKCDGSCSSLTARASFAIAADDSETPDQVCESDDDHTVD
jgi:hypothetical protein